MKVIEKCRKNEINKNEFLSVCGTDCSSCYCLEQKICNGCNKCEGKVFHSKDERGCHIYCCCLDHEYSSCLECKDIPCDIWKKTRDPKFSDEEFEKNIKDRVKRLKDNLSNKKDT